VVVDKPGDKPFSRISMALAIAVPRLMQAWNQRHWLAPRFRLLQPRLATEAGQAPTADADYGHFGLRLSAGLPWCYTSRFVFKGPVPMEEIVVTLKHDWRTGDDEPFALYVMA
jgi:hypothetical protein